MEFELHPNLKSKLFLFDLPLSRVLLEDERHYPWVLLVPRVSGAHRIIDLQTEVRQQFYRELDLVQEVMQQEFNPDQLNVAAIGIKTPQLHVHVIGRFKNDPAWPHTVWDHPIRDSYSVEAREKIVDRLKSQLKKEWIA